MLSTIRAKFRAKFFLGLLALGMALGALVGEALHASPEAVAQTQNVQVAVERWLEVRSLSGEVFYQSEQQRRPARMSDRLMRVGDRLETARRSTATLAIDAGSGFIDLAERTTLSIQQLAVAPSGGRITQLSVPNGQIRLQVPTLTNPDSRLEIETPAGWSGVRGTEFGLVVRPDGSTGIATLSGRVQASAQGASVQLPGGFQSLVLPNEPPTPPVPLTEDVSLNVTRLERRGTLAYVSGRIDPINLLLVEGAAEIVTRDGSFEISLPISGRNTIAVVVITPLGKRQSYELALL